MDEERAKRAIRDFVEALDLPGGEVDAAATGAAVASAFADDLLRGYRGDPREFLASTVDGAGDDLVLVRDVPFVSVCGHHLLPFHGAAHVAYLPAGKVAGLSSIARVVDGYACRLQTQERLARAIATALHETLGARGAACRIEATQLCVVGRATRQAGIRTVSECLLGVFESDPAERRRFHDLLGPARTSDRWD